MDLQNDVGLFFIHLSFIFLLVFFPFVYVLIAFPIHSLILAFLFILMFQGILSLPFHSTPYSGA